ncbi:MAG: hypothetical protein H7281_12225 [Bacteriovorax sp.]|nr:hypothetical protein [Bacteriovorax sp.]
MKKNDYQKILNQKGQALFEMILFLPFLMFLYTIYYTAGNSISGSINQQKAVRGYFYTLVKGNSYIVPLVDLRKYKEESITRVGFNSLGWKDHLAGKISVAPCFQFSSLLKNDSTETCGGKSEVELSSRFIRLFTFYGVCGPYYNYTQTPLDDKGYYDIDPHVQALTVSCTMGH